MPKTSTHLNIPPHQEWFFDNVCNKNRTDYLKFRRMVAITYHQAKSVMLTTVTSEPILDGNFDNPSWSQAAISESFVLNGIHSFDNPPRAKTVFRALRFRDNIYIAVRAEDPDGIARSVGEKSVLLNGQNLQHLPYFSDYVSIAFDPHHHHDQYVEFFATPSGGKGSFSGKRQASLYPVHPISTGVSKDENDARFNSQWKLKVKRDKDKKGWTAMFKIPFVLLSGNESIPPVIGFNAHRFKHSGLPEQSLWSEIGWLGENVEVPLRFGDMYVKGAPARLGKFWLGEWRYGKNEIVAEVRNHTPGRCRIEWIVDVWSQEGAKVKTSRCKMILSAGKNIVKIPYLIHFIGRGFIRLRLMDAKSQAAIYDGRYWLESSPRLGEKVSTPPSASYNLKKTCALASRLPRMIRMTTADGGPSDFYLRSPDGKIAFNLMEQGVMKKIARMIERRFTDPDDRLAAASMFIHQPDVMVYELIENFSEITNTPLSIMRFGSGICGSFATVIKGLVEQLSPPGGGRYVAYRCGLSRRRAKNGKLLTLESHTLVIVFCPDGRQIILNDGVVYFSKKTGKLLTADDDELQKYLPLMKNFKKSMIIDSGSLPWPDGAPVK